MGFTSGKDVLKSYFLCILILFGRAGQWALSLES
jgi:hypothetical protein